jgi:tetratricopeptide (TPR) repeat protein
MSDAVLERDRVTRRLVEASRYPATIVCAREGYGKTTAIRRYLETQFAPASELGLLPEHCTLAAFARALAEVLEPVAPGLRSSYARAIEFAQQAEHAEEELAIWFLGHLSGKPERIIFIDDFHHAYPDDRTFTLIERLIKGAPSGFRWLLGTREMPALARRWGDAHLCGAPIDERELRLTELESFEIAALKGLTDAQAAAMYRMTAGWPLAVMLGTSLPQWIDRLGPLRPRSSEGLYAFLAEQLFMQFDESLQELLMNACVFTTLEEDVIAASNWRDSWNDVQLLARDGWLLSLRHNGSIRFRDLFRQFLETRLEQRNVGVKQTCVFAAELLEQCGRSAEALSLYARAGDDVAIVRLCEQRAFDLIDEGRIDDVQRAFETLDPEIAGHSAIALAVNAIAESHASRSDIAESWFLQALDQARSPLLRAHIGYRYALDLVRSARTDAIAILEQYLKEDLPVELAAEMRATLAAAYVLVQRFDDARSMIATAVSLMDESRSRQLHAKIYQHAAWVALFTGNIGSSKIYVSCAVDLALQCGLFEVAGRAYAVLYNISYDIEDNPKKTIEILNHILDCGLKAGSASLRLFALLCTVDACAEMGDSLGLATTQKMLEAHGVIYTDQVTSETLLPAEALMLAGRGRFTQAYSIISATGNRQSSADRRVLRFSEIAIYAAAAGLRREAKTALSELTSQLPECEEDARRTIRTQLNHALALRLLGERDQADAIFNDLRRHTESMSRRMRALHDCVGAIFSNWDGIENYNEVYEHLRELRESDFGGLASALAALPCEREYARSA